MSESRTPFLAVHDVQGGIICPTCGGINTKVDGVNTTGLPAPGDFTLCVLCLTWHAVVDHQGGLRHLTADERDMVRTDPLFKAATAQLVTLKAAGVVR